VRNRKESVGGQCKMIFAACVVVGAMGLICVFRANAIPVCSGKKVVEGECTEGRGCPEMENGQCSGTMIYSQAS